MNKLIRDILLAGGPIIVGVGAVLIKGLDSHAIDWWLVASAGLGGLLTAYFHFATSASTTP